MANKLWDELESANSDEVVNPVVPEGVVKQPVQVYVPVATTDKKGIANFDPRDFMVQGGKVSLLRSQQGVAKQIEREAQRLDEKIDEETNTIKEQLGGINDGIIEEVAEIKQGMASFKDSVTQTVNNNKHEVEQILDGISQTIEENQSNINDRVDNLLALHQTDKGQINQSILTEQQRAEGVEESLRDDLTAVDERESTHYQSLVESISGVDGEREANRVALDTRINHIEAEHTIFSQIWKEHLEEENQTVEIDAEVLNQIATNTQRIQDLGIELASAKGQHAADKITTNSAIGLLDERITELEGHLDEHEQITANEQEIGVVDGKVTTLRQDYNSLLARVAALEDYTPPVVQTVDDEVEDINIAYTGTEHHVMDASWWDDNKMELANEEDDVFVVANRKCIPIAGVGEFAGQTTYIRVTTTPIEIDFGNITLSAPIAENAILPPIFENPQLQSSYTISGEFSTAEQTALAYLSDKFTWDLVDQSGPNETYQLRCTVPYITVVNGSMSCTRYHITTLEDLVSNITHTYDGLSHNITDADWWDDNVMELSSGSDSYGTTVQTYTAVVAGVEGSEYEGQTANVQVLVSAFNWQVEVEGLELLENAALPAPFDNAALTTSYTYVDTLTTAERLQILGPNWDQFTWEPVQGEEDQYMLQGCTNVNILMSNPLVVTRTANTVPELVIGETELSSDYTISNNNRSGGYFPWFNHLMGMLYSTGLYGQVYYWQSNYWASTSINFIGGEAVSQSCLYNSIIFAEENDFRIIKVHSTNQNAARVSDKGDYTSMIDFSTYMGPIQEYFQHGEIKAHKFLIAGPKGLDDLVKCKTYYVGCNQDTDEVTVKYFDENHQWVTCSNNNLGEMLVAAGFTGTCHSYYSWTDGVNLHYWYNDGVNFKSWFFDVQTGLWREEDVSGLPTPSGDKPILIYDHDEGYVYSFDPVEKYFYLYNPYTCSWVKFPEVSSVAFTPTEGFYNTSGWSALKSDGRKVSVKLPTPTGYGWDRTISPHTFTLPQNLVEYTLTGNVSFGSRVSTSSEMCGNSYSLARTFYSPWDLCQYVYVDSKSAFLPMSNAYNYSSYSSGTKPGGDGVYGMNQQSYYYIWDHFIEDDNEAPTKAVYNEGGSQFKENPQGVIFNNLPWPQMDKIWPMTTNLGTKVYVGVSSENIVYICQNITDPLYSWSWNRIGSKIFKTDARFSTVRPNSTGKRAFYWGERGLNELICTIQNDEVFLDAYLFKSWDELGVEDKQAGRLLGYETQHMVLFENSITGKFYMIHENANNVCVVDYKGVAPLSNTFNYSNILMYGTWDKPNWVTSSASANADNWYNSLSLPKLVPVGG